MQPPNILSAGDDDVERARRAHEASKILGIDSDKVLAFIREQDRLNALAVSISDPSSIAQAESVVDPARHSQLWERIPPFNSQESLPSHISDENFGQALVSTNITSLQLDRIEQYTLPVHQHEYSKEWQPSHQSSIIPLDPSFDNPSNAFTFDLASYPSMYALPGSKEYFPRFGDSSVRASLDEDGTTTASGGYNGVASFASGVEDNLDSSVLDSIGNTMTFDVPAHLTSQVNLPNLSVQRLDRSGLNPYSKERSIHPKNGTIPAKSHFGPSFDLAGDGSNTLSILPITHITDSGSNFLGSASNFLANQNQVNLYAVAQHTPLTSSPHSQLALGEIQHAQGRQMDKSAGQSLASLKSPRNLPNLAPIAQKRKVDTLDPLNFENTATHIAKATTRKKHRGTYTAEDRLETSRTRKLVSCIRCHRQRIRCQPNPENEALPCVQCLESKPRLFSLGCMRYKISDSILFRTGVAGNVFYQSHPFTGRNYGDFTLQATRNWVDDQVHFLEITQDRGTVCRLEIRQFDPPEVHDGTDSRNRSMFLIPWAIADADKATASINQFLDKSLSPYINCLLEENDHLVWEIFHTASSNAYLPNQPVDETQKILLRQVLRLWVACRFVEGKWHCVGEDKLGAANAKSPYRLPGWVSVPPYVDYQFASVVMHRVLEPLRVATLRTLQRLVEGNKSTDWYTIVLVTFILLHNYERGVFFQRGFWAKRKVPVLYLDMPLIRGIHSGAKAILAHFHYSCKGNIPFAPNFDWNSRQARRMAQLNHKQVQFMIRLRALAQQKATEMGNVSDSHRYEAPYWFTSQLFEEGWKPRNTFEHSPEASPWPPAPKFGPMLPPEIGVP